MINLEIDLTPLTTLIDNKESKITDLTPLKDRLTKIVQDDLKQRFDSSPPIEIGGFVHGNIYWRALALSTIKQRKFGQILIDTGALRDSYTVTGSQYFISEIDGTVMTFTNTLPKASYPNVVSRPVLVMHDRLKDNMENEIAEYVNE